MTQYQHVPPIGAHALPEPLLWRPTRNRSSRNGHVPRVVFVHRWSGGTFDGVCSWFKTSSGADAVSSHLVYAGELGRDAGRCAQMVAIADKAWTESLWNPIGISIECADAVWLGGDVAGFATTARIVAFLCHRYGIPPHELDAHAIAAGAAGFARHADGGAAGGGHTSCPTTDLALWNQFAERVVLEYRHGGFRGTWTR